MRPADRKFADFERWERCSMREGKKRLELNVSEERTKKVALLSSCTIEFENARTALSACVTRARVQCEILGKK